MFAFNLLFKILKYNKEVGQDLQKGLSKLLYLE